MHLSTFRVQNPFEVHNVSTFLPQLVGKRENTLKKLESWLGEKITLNVAASRTQRSLSEALEKMSCPCHHGNEILKFLKQNDGSNGLYDVSPLSLCNGILCDSENYRTVATDDTIYETVASFALTELTTFQPDTVSSTHRIKVAYNDCEVEIDIQKMNKRSLISFLSNANQTGFGGVVIGQKTSDISMTDTQSSMVEVVKGSVWLPLNDDLLLEFEMVSYELKLVWNNLKLHLSGAVGMTASQETLIQQYRSMVNNPVHNIGREKNMEKIMCDGVRQMQSSTTSMQPPIMVATVTTYPCVVLYTGNWNWQRSLEQSKLNVYHKKTGTGVIRVNNVLINPNISAAVPSVLPLDEYKESHTLAKPPPWINPSGDFVSFTPFSPSASLSSAASATSSTGWNSGGAVMKEVKIEKTDDVWIGMQPPFKKQRKM